MLARIFKGSATLFVVLAILSPAHGQSGRVKPSPKKPTIAPVPVESPSPSVPEKPKKSDLPKIVDGERIYLGSEVDTKALILKRPAPGSTREAMRHSLHGKVVLQAILSVSGQVTHITVLKGLPYGLSEKAIEAARQIKFEPAIRDGESVSVWVGIEYEFWFI